MSLRGRRSRSRLWGFWRRLRMSWRRRRISWRGIILRMLMCCLLTWLIRLFNCSAFWYVIDVRYFERVHPLFPIVAKEAFLSAYQKTEQRTLQDHFVWSVFLAGSSFSEDARLVEGPHSRA